MAAKASAHGAVIEPPIVGGIAVVRDNKNGLMLIKRANRM